MCDTLAAQSIGEPATQMTLKTFHPRRSFQQERDFHCPATKEIINVATNIKTPSLKVFLQLELNVSAELAKNVQQQLAYMFYAWTIQRSGWHGQD
jgi:DNA-directed RNA polymerase II subunit RPB1